MDYKTTYTQELFNVFCAVSELNSSFESVENHSVSSSNRPVNCSQEQKLVISKKLQELELDEAYRLYILKKQIPSDPVPPETRCTEVTKNSKELSATEVLPSCSI